MASSDEQQDRLREILRGPTRRRNNLIIPDDSSDEEQELTPKQSTTRRNNVVLVDDSSDEEIAVTPRKVKKRPNEAISNDDSSEKELSVIPNKVAKRTRIYRGREKGVSELQVKQKIWNFGVEDVENGGTKLLTDELNIQAEDDLAMRNLRRVNKIRSQLSLARNVHMTGRHDIGPLPDFFEGPVYDNRSFSPDNEDSLTPKQKHRRRKDWGDDDVVVVRDKSENEHPSPHDNDLLIFRLEKDILTEEEREILARYLCRVCERFPAELYTGNPRTVKAMILSIAMDTLLQNSSSQATIKLPGLVFQGGGKYYSFECKFISPDAKVEVFHPKLNIEAVHRDSEPESIPAKFEMNTLDIPDGLPAQVQQKHRLAQEHMRWFAWFTFGRISTREAMMGFFGTFRDSCSTPPRRSCSMGVYNGKTAVRIAREMRIMCVLLRPGTAPMADIIRPNGVILPSLRIYSFANARISKVLNVWFNRWRLEHFLEGYLDSANGCDDVNKEIANGEPTLNRCGCAGDSSICPGLVCDRCHEISPCVELERYGLTEIMICAPCQSSLPTEEDRSRGRVLKTMRNLVCIEAKILGHNHERYRADCDKLQDSLLASPSWINWSSQRDEYVMSESGERAIRTRNEFNRVKPDPFKPSLDAVRPFYLTKEGSTGLHCPGNVSFTAVCINQAAGYWVKGLLAVVSAFIGGQISTDIFDRKVMAVHSIALETKCPKKHRVGKRMSPEEFAVVEQRWRTLTPLHSLPVPIARGKSGYRTADCTTLHIAERQPDWKPRGYERIQRIVHQIRQKFSSERGETVELYMSEDGCPYPFSPRFMPDDWSWWKMWCFCTYQVRQMWLFYNARFVQYDACENLFFEYVWAYCSGGQSKNRMFPELPLNLLRMNPMKVALSHAWPAQQMRTGWAELPQSIADRDESLSNFTVESVFENLLKMNYSPDLYEEVRENIRRIKLTEELFDRTTLQETETEMTTANAEMTPELRQWATEAMQAQENGGYEPEFADAYGWIECEDMETVEEDFTVSEEPARDEAMDDNSAVEPEEPDDP